MDGMKVLKFLCSSNSVQHVKLQNKMMMVTYVYFLGLN